LLQAKIGSVLKNVRYKNILIRGNGSRAMKTALAEFSKGTLDGPYTGFLTIWGTNGNGKSTALMAAVNEALELMIPSVYLTADELIDYLKAGIQDKQDVQSRFMLLVEVDVLAIDELSLVPRTDWNMNKLQRLIDQRYRAGKGTLFAMDTDPEKYLERRAFSRLQTGIIVKNTDADMRPSIGKIRELQQGKASINKIQ